MPEKIHQLKRNTMLFQLRLPVRFAIPLLGEGFQAAVVVVYTITPQRVERGGDSALA